MENVLIFNPKGSVPQLHTLPLDATSVMLFEPSLKLESSGGYLL